MSLNLGEGLDLLNIGLDVGNMGLLGKEGVANLGRGGVMAGRERGGAGRRSFDFEGRGGKRKPQGRR